MVSDSTAPKPLGVIVNPNIIGVSETYEAGAAAGRLLALWKDSGYVEGLDSLFGRPLRDARLCAAEVMRGRQSCGHEPEQCRPTNGLPPGNLRLDRPVDLDTQAAAVVRIDRMMLRLIESELSNIAAGKPPSAPGKLRDMVRQIEEVLAS